MCHRTLSAVGHSVGASRGRMVVSLPGQRSRIPLHGIVWSGIHYIWGRPTTISYPGPCYAERGCGPPFSMLFAKQLTSENPQPDEKLLHALL